MKLKMLFALLLCFGTVSTGLAQNTTLSNGLRLDSSGNLLVNVATGGGGSNASVGSTGSSTPTAATLIGGNTAGNFNPVTIKAASTSAAAADPSLVTAFSPNSPLPSGTNSIGTVAPTLSANTLVIGQQAVTASAAALPSTALARPACVYALSSNSLTVYVGGTSGVTTSNGFPLVAGSSLCGLSVSNLNQIYVIASSTGSSVAWSAQ